MSTLKNVAVVGASGSIGKAVVNALLAGGFSVTALTRESSSATFPAGVAVKNVDYESVDSVKGALQGQDALVSAAATEAVGQQFKIIDAAIAAGVKRFIPSEFGINLRTVSHAELKSILQGKIKVLDYAIQKSKEDPSFSWTGVSTGLFFDWGFRFTGLGFDKANKAVSIVDSGNTPFFVSNIPFIGKGVAAVLANPDKTANQYLSIASLTTTQNELQKLVEEQSGEKWTPKPVKSSELNSIAKEKLSKHDYSGFIQFLQAYLWGDEGDSTKSVELANGLLGLQSEDPRPTIKAWLDGTL